MHMILKFLNRYHKILYEMVEKKKFQEVTPKEKIQDEFKYYSDILANAYSYNRWKGDRVACWVTREVDRICNEENDVIN